MDSRAQDDEFRTAADDNGIYLHDTPDKKLFAKLDRDFSNDYIRLEDAAALGKWLLGKPICASSKALE